MQSTIVQTVKRKCIVYIDGYNWYHAVFKHHPEWKWLNIQSFFETLRLDDDVIAVKLFSSMINPLPDPSALERQEKYFSALKTLPKVRIILGKFQPRQVTCRAQCRQNYMVDEEKKTDVNMAVEIMSDAIDGKAGLLCVVTGDSDIQPAIEWVSKRHPSLKITVYVPALPVDQRDRRTDYYKTKGLNVGCQFLPLGDLNKHQLPHNVKLENKTFSCKPETWNI
jgi:hypothetical protein